MEAGEAALALVADQGQVAEAALVAGQVAVEVVAGPVSLVVAAGGHLLAECLEARAFQSNNISPVTLTTSTRSL